MTQDVPQAMPKVDTKTKPMKVVRRRSFLPLMVSLVALASAVTVPLWQDAIYGVRKDADLVRAEEKIASLEGEVVAWHSPLASLAGRVESLENQDNQIAEAPSSHAENLAPVEQELKRMQEQIDVLAKQVEAQKGATLADRTLVVVLLQLFLAWQKGESFEEPWKIALDVARATDPRLAALMEQAAPFLEPMKEKGLKSVSSLQSGFSSVAHAVLQASRGKEGSWWQQAWANVKGLVSVRRQGAESGEGSSGVDAALAQAEVLLGKGNLSGVVQTLKTYTATGNQAVQSWMAEVQAREVADQLSDQMLQYMVQKMMPPSDGGARGVAP